MMDGSHILIISSLLVLSSAISSRTLKVPLMVLCSFSAIILPVIYGLSLCIFLITGISILIFLALTCIYYKKEFFKFDRSHEIKWWRIFARPFALLFIPINILFGHKFLLFLLGILCIIFISSDLYRLFSKKHLPAFYKKSEIHRFSSMTSFLVAIFIIFLLFRPAIAYLCLTFILFGDLAGKIFGLKFGRIKIFQQRTLEGSLGFLTGSLYFGFIICSIFQINFSYLMIGAFCATIFEHFSFYFDDNFTVGVLTGGCLEALIFFNVI